jgi:hypothetical protein
MIRRCREEEKVNRSRAGRCVSDLINLHRREAIKKRMINEQCDFLCRNKFCIKNIIKKRSFQFSENKLKKSLCVEIGRNYQGKIKASRVFLITKYFGLKNVSEKYSAVMRKRIYHSFQSPNLYFSSECGFQI